MIKQKRIVVYIPEDSYRLLRSKLILMGKTVSSWFRELVQELLEN
jgi:hypothetical protein